MAHLRRSEVVLNHNLHQLYFLGAEPQPFQNVGRYGCSLFGMPQETHSSAFFNRFRLRLGKVMKQRRQFE